MASEQCLLLRQRGVRAFCGGRPGRSSVLSSLKSWPSGAAGVPSLTDPRLPGGAVALGVGGPLQLPRQQPPLPGRRGSSGRSCWAT